MKIYPTIEDYALNNKSFFDSTNTSLLTTLKKMWLEWYEGNNSANIYNYVVQKRYQDIITKPIKDKEDAEKQIDGSISLLWENPYIDNEQIHSFIDRFFSPSLLKKSLVNKILFQNNVNVIKLDDMVYFLPNEMLNFVKNSIGENKLATAMRRAHNSTHYHRQTWWYYHTPIVLFNQQYAWDATQLDDQYIQDNGLDYLLNIDTDQRFQTYYLWHIAHEVAHHIFNYIIYDDKNLLKKRKKICDQEWFITKYVARSYNQNNDMTFYDENFAESVRLYCSNPIFLQNKNSNIYQFIQRILE